MKAGALESNRIASLDQFRGYAVAGMFLVNFIGGFAVMPAVLKHHNTYCSYADTVMPHFFFAVGFAYRLTFLKRLEKGEVAPAYRHAVTRSLGLILLGLCLYRLDGGFASWQQVGELGLLQFFAQHFRSEPWQALVHIGVTSLWILPVIAARPSLRIAFAVASAFAYTVLSHLFYFDWVTHNAWDGGPLGFMTWTLPALAGSLAYDLISRTGARRSIGWLVLWGFVLMLFGYGLSCVTAVRQWSAGIGATEGLGVWFSALPFVPPDSPIDLWSMSQRAGSVSYQTFGAGFSMALLALFVWVCDIKGFQLGLFRTFGTNALTAYVLHAIVYLALEPFCPRDAPLWYAGLMLVAFFAIIYVFVRSLEKRGTYIRL